MRACVRAIVRACVRAIVRASYIVYYFLLTHVKFTVRLEEVIEHEARIRGSLDAAIAFVGLHHHEHILTTAVYGRWDLSATVLSNQPGGCARACAQTRAHALSHLQHLNHATTNPFAIKHLVAIEHD